MTQSTGGRLQQHSTEYGQHTDGNQKSNCKWNGIKTLFASVPRLPIPRLDCIKVKTQSLTLLAQRHRLNC